MNPLTFISSNWRLIMVGLLIAGNVLFFRLWQDTKAEYIRYGAGVEALGKQAVVDKAKVEADHEQNLKDVKNEFEKNLPDVRAGAVAAYLAAHRVPDVAGRGAMPGIASRQPSNDGAGKECVPDEAFIADAADDAAKVAEWQEWARLNRFEVR